MWVIVVRDGVPIEDGPGVPANQAPFRLPSIVSVESNGRVYIPDIWTLSICMIDTAGILTVIAGNGEFRAGGDGVPAMDAALGRPSDVAISDTDTLYIVDSFSDLVRKVDSDVLITTIAGTGVSRFSGDGSLARDFHLRFPTAVDVRSDRPVWVVDAFTTFASSRRRFRYRRSHRSRTERDSAPACRPDPSR